MILFLPLRRSALGWLPLGALLALSHCAPTSIITVTDYDQSCEVATDCVLIKAGEACGACGPNVAINKGDLASYEDDLANLACEDFYTLCPAGIPDIKPACTEGRCDVVPLRDNGL